jgi:hypothetical protein
VAARKRGRFDSEGGGASGKKGARGEMAKWHKKHFKLQGIVSNYYFCPADRQFRKFRAGVGFIRVRIRGRNNYMCSI